MTKRTIEKEKETAKSSTPNWVKIFQTSYFRYRHWIRNLLIEGKIKKFRFVKDEVGYTGSITVDKPEVDKAKKVLQNYKDKNPDVKDMWW